ncbi:purine-nucleoside phosphorylase [Chelatococcus sp. SYSU_G07232]|uniref:Purine nucleoside phosphorylase n=1 Tax=Chelatococcus albus TaxID=3047466 RepID=A0ABT7ADZ6_9HYPH|nr:purine-nucleoside phosphorylase [Chelatococcus sp. SYSU_G07232]MDJ1157605.1 purine-nucleoside phosphorylase [Chelatococcus sp. SYSU_G07232]
MAEPILDQALQTLVDRGITGPFDYALVLGTGLGKLAEDLEDAITIPYAEIPGFPASGVSGHAGSLHAGRLEGRNVLIYGGRAHYYETGDARVMRVPIALLAALGSPKLVLTNAAGSLKQSIRVGSLALITDHINYSGLNPLIGDTGDGRFVSMTDAYDARLRKRFKLAAIASGITLNEGIYMWFSGPSFETPAEVRMARMLGADLVGMSTVPEVILARRYRLRVAAVSVITNLAAGIEGAAPSHGETKDVAAGAAAGLRRIIRAFIARPDDV